MKTKNFALAVVVAVVATGIGIAIPTSQAHAINTPNGRFITQEEHLQAKASGAAAKQSADLTRVIQKGDQMITLRISNLTTLKTRVQNDTRLTSDEKTNFINDITTTVTNLQTLKTKIDADTDLTTARADVKSIVTNYRVYLFFEPKLRLSLIIDNLQTATTTVSSLSARVAALANTLKSQGQDVSAIQSLLTDVNAKLTDISTRLTTDKALVSNVTITTTNPQSVFTQVRQDLAIARQDFAAIRSDFAKMRVDFHGLSFKVTPTPTP